MSEVDARSTRILERLKIVARDLSGFSLDELRENSTFLELGFDSLFLTQIAAAFQNEFGVKITFRQLFDDLPTLQALSQYVAAQSPTAGGVEPAPAPVAPAPAPVVAQVASPAPPPVALVAPAAPMAALSLPSFVAPRLSPVAGDQAQALQAVMAHQLEVMSQQLQMLRAMNGEAVIEAPQAAPAPLAVAAPAAPAAAPSAPVALAVATPKDEAPTPSAMPKGFGPQVSAKAGKEITERQRQHLDSLIARYNEKTKTSKRLTQEYRQVHADPRTAAGFNRLWKEMVYPIWVKRSAGARLWDVDDNEYIDMLNGFGPNFLGHSPPFVTQALHEQIEKGFEVGPQTPLVGEVARMFTELTGMDRVSFVNTGSEAVQAAIRLSRTMTGRNKIVLFSGDYHGNFDEVLVRVTKTGDRRRTFPLAPGIPLRAVEDVLVLDYGTEESLEIIKKHAGEIATVLVEPVQSRRPDFQPREFLHALRKITADEGIVLVFDEVITGFRICPGGAQQYYGVEADLATYGKIVGGGMPIGVVAGRSKFMDTFDGGSWQYGDDSFPAQGVTFFAGTFVRHPLAIAAAHAALTYLKAAGPALQEGVNRRTTRYTTAVNRLFEEHGIHIKIPHFASQMYIKNQEENELATLLFFHLRLRGIHLLENFPTYMTAAHTDEDVETLIRAFRESVGELQDAEILPRSAALLPPPILDATPFPLTEPQREIWIGSQLDGEASCAFNESDSIALDGELDLDALRRAVSQVFSRHEALRLRFAEDGSSQWPDPLATFDLPVIDLSGGSESAQEVALDDFFKREALTPFDLAKGPVVRTKLLRLSPDRHIFVIYGHHLVFDGWSAEAVVKELGQVYSALRGADAPQLPPAVPYREYVDWAQAQGSGPAHEEAIRFWESVLLPELPPPLDLPTDRPRPGRRSFRGGTIHHVLPPEIYRGLRATCGQLKTTFYVAVLSAFEVLLSRLTTQQDFVVGIPAAGQAPFGKNLVGYCVNLLPLRARCEGTQTFSELCKSNRKLVLDAVENQIVSLSELVPRLGVPRDPSRLPLVEVVFNCSRYFGDVQFEGLRVGSRENRRQAVYHDLFLNVIESGGDLVIDWDFNADIFDADTLRRWVSHLEVLLAGIITEPEATLDELPIMTAREAEKVRAQWRS